MSLGLVGQPASLNWSQNEVESDLRGHSPLTSHLHIVHTLCILTQEDIQMNEKLKISTLFNF